MESCLACEENTAQDIDTILSKLIERTDNDVLFFIFLVAKHMDCVNAVHTSLQMLCNHL
jgi:hypothetical protein